MVQSKLHRCNIFFHSLYYNLSPQLRIMLKTPYTRYNRLYVYHLDLAELPQLDDPDLIAAWLEDNSALFFFHTPRKN